MRKPGRLKIKLAEMLSKALPDVVIDAEDIKHASGEYKKSMWDCPRWDACVSLRDTGSYVVIKSFSSITDCVRNGIDVTRDNLCQVEVDAKPRKAKVPKKATE